MNPTLTAFGLVLSLLGYLPVLLGAMNHLSLELHWAFAVAGGFCLLAALLTGGERGAE